VKEKRGISNSEVSNIAG